MRERQLEFTPIKSVCAVRLNAYLFFFGQFSGVGIIEHFWHCVFDWLKLFDLTAVTRWSQFNCARTEHLLTK